MKQATSHLYPVYLSDEQRERLTDITRHGSAPVRKVRRAQVLLWSDRHREGGRLSRTEISERLGMHVNTVDRIRKAFVLDGEAPAITRKPRLVGPTPPKLDGRGEAQLVAICCSPPPEGRVQWTLYLLVDELKTRRIVTTICAESFRGRCVRRLKKRAAALAEKDLVHPRTRRRAPPEAELRRPDGTGARRLYRPGRPGPTPDLHGRGG